MTDRRLERIRWHSRRGLLELDLILTRFLDAELAGLSAVELGQLEEVLRLSDNDFLDLLMGRVECGDERIRPMIERLRTA